MQARYYDPVIGRFYSNDPVGYTAANPVMSFNRYLYVNNNPYKYTDPNGEYLLQIINAAIEMHTAWEAVKDSGGTNFQKGIAVAAGGLIGMFAGKAGSKAIQAVAKQFTKGVVQSTAKATATVVGGGITGGVTGGSTQVAADASVGKLSDSGDIIESTGKGFIAGTIASTPVMVGATGPVATASGVLVAEGTMQVADKLQEKHHY